MAENRSQVQELYYERASTGRRLSALLFDAFCCFLFGFVFLALVLFLLNGSSFVKDRMAVRQEISLRSGLYVLDDEQQLRTFLETLDEKEGIDEKSSRIDACLESFYAQVAFFPEGNGKQIYADYKEQALTPSGEKMFQNGTRNLVNDDYDRQYLDFYEESFQVALGYLLQNPDYAKATREIVWIYTFSIVADFLLPIGIFFLIVPLCFTRTRQTFGMRLTRLALVSANGLAVKTGKMIGRFVFLFLVEIILSLVAFLIPFAVSFGMMILSKSHQSLHDYVFNTYCVFLDKGTIFKDKAEYRLSQEESEDGMTLEDKKYRPVSGVDHEIQS